MLPFSPLPSLLRLHRWVLSYITISVPSLIYCQSGDGVVSILKSAPSIQKEVKGLSTKVITELETSPKDAVAAMKAAAARESTTT